MDIGLLAGILLGLAVLWAALVAVLWLVRPRGTPARVLVSVVPDVLRLARAIITDAGVPLDVRAAVGFAAAWVISPIDLIPEFLPVVGPLDDLVVTVLVLRYVRRRLGTKAIRDRWPGTADGFQVLARLMGEDGPG